MLKIRSCLSFPHTCLMGKIIWKMSQNSLQMFLLSWIALSTVAIHFCSVELQETEDHNNWQDVEDQQSIRCYKLTNQAGVMRISHQTYVSSSLFSFLLWIFYNNHLNLLSLLDFCFHQISMDLQLYLKSLRNQIPWDSVLTPSKL